MKIAQSAVKRIPVGIVISSFDVIGTVMLKGEYKLLLPEQILFFSSNINDYQQTQMKLKTICGQDFNRESKYSC